jgi:hypothetical protein
MTPTRTPTPTATPTRTPTITPTPAQSYERECEYPNEATVGQMIYRSNASKDKVHGQFGSQSISPYAARAGYVRYTGIQIDNNLSHLYLKLRYSKHSSSTVPIQVSLDNEATPRASFYPQNQYSWNEFSWTALIDLGTVSRGTHTITFHTTGQQYGVADLDVFVLLH